MALVSALYASPAGKMLPARSPPPTAPISPAQQGEQMMQRLSKNRLMPGQGTSMMTADKGLPTLGPAISKPGSL
jgi:hypothetical protein